MNPISSILLMTMPPFTIRRRRFRVHAAEGIGAAARDHMRWYKWIHPNSGRRRLESCGTHQEGVRLRRGRVYFFWSGFVCELLSFTELLSFESELVSFESAAPFDFTSICDALWVFGSKLARTLSPGWTWAIDAVLPSRLIWASLPTSKRCSSPVGNTTVMIIAVGSVDFTSPLTCESVLAVVVPISTFEAVFAEADCGLSSVARVADAARASAPANAMTVLVT